MKTVYSSDQQIIIDAGSIYSIKYGTIDHSIDITEAAFQKCVNNNILTIPSCDFARADLFTDPLQGVNKQIFIEYNASQFVEYLDYQSTTMSIDEVSCIKYGTRDYSIDITDAAFQKCVDNNILTIPSGDFKRSELFTDPTYGLTKYIFLKYSNSKINKINKTNILSLNNIIVNSTNVLIDSFMSFKKKSLVLIFNNYRYILETTTIDLDKTTITINNKNIDFIFLREFNDFNSIEEVNHKLFLNNKFHHEVLVVENFKINNILLEEPDESYKVDLSLFNRDGVLVVRKTLEIEPINSYFLDKKCISTIHKNEHELIPSWISYHKKIGFEKFIIYDNDFNESKNIKIMTELKDYADDIYIINANWDYWVDSYGIQAVGQAIQQNHAIWKYSPMYLLLSDLDEYVNFNNFNLFNENIPIVSIPNYWFGCNNKTDFNYDDFKYKLTKRQAHCEKRQQRKCLIQTAYVDLFCVHLPIIFNGGVYYLDEKDGALNHYFILSNKKRNCDCNIYCAVEDLSILSK